MGSSKQAGKAGWLSLPFSESVQVNPAVRLAKEQAYPFVSMADVEPKMRNVVASEQREYKSGGSRFQNGDTLMARITPCLENGKISRYFTQGGSDVAHGSTEFIVIRGRPDVTDSDFAYYLTCSDKVREYAISQMTGTSGRQRVPTSALSDIIVAIPSLPEQRRIAGILGALDDKIALNRRMNATLEGMAQALFRHWFVDYEPVRAKMSGRWRRGESLAGMLAELWDAFPARLAPTALGEAPAGWVVRSLDEIAQFRNGLALQKYRPKDGEESLPVVKIAQLRSGRADSGELATRDITPECVIDSGDVIFAWSASLMVKVWCGGKAALNQHLFKVTSSEYPRWFYLHWLEAHLPEFRRIAADKTTTMGHIKRQHLSEAKCVTPSRPLLDAADGILGDLYAQRVALEVQSSKLAEMRDALLPQLLSGELRV